MMSSAAHHLSGHTLAPPASAGAAGAIEAADHTDFSAQLDRAVTGRDPEKRAQQAEQAAQQLVATAFIRPMLEELGRATFASDQFKPGAGEKRMRPLLDAEIADRIAAAPSFPLVDAVRDRLLGDHRPTAMMRRPSDA